MGKLFWSQLDVAIHEAALDALGGDAERTSEWSNGYLFSLAGPIYAGTNEIQRNIVAERLLGLPGEGTWTSNQVSSSVSSFRSVARLLSDGVGIAAARGWAEGESDPTRILWKRLGEQGVLGLCAPSGVVRGGRFAGRLGACHGRDRRRRGARPFGRIDCRTAHRALRHRGCTED